MSASLPDIRLFRVRIWRDDSKHVAGWIFRVSKPPDLRNRHLGHADFSATLLNLLYRLIERWNGNRVQCAGTLTFARTR
jgi:hypothetical protein